MAGPQRGSQRLELATTVSGSLAWAYHDRLVVPGAQQQVEEAAAVLGVGVVEEQQVGTGHEVAGGVAPEVLQEGGEEDEVEPLLFVLVALVAPEVEFHEGFHGVRVTDHGMAPVPVGSRR